MDPDTDIGGPLHKFPATNHSAIVGARSDDQLTRRRAFDTILTSYWKPAYKYIRLKWQANNQDAKDENPCNPWLITRFSLQEWLGFQRLWSILIAQRKRAAFVHRHSRVFAFCVEDVEADTKIR
jgi:hypothetical protein